MWPVVLLAVRHLTSTLGKLSVFFSRVIFSLFLSNMRMPLSFHMYYSSYHCQELYENLTEGCGETL